MANVTFAEEALGEETLSFANGSGRKLVPRYSCNPEFPQGPSECFSVRFSPDSQMLAASFGNGQINVYNSETGDHEMILYHVEGGVVTSQLPTTQLRWRPSLADRKMESALISVCAEDDGKIRQWDIKTGKCVSKITEPGNQPFCVDYFADGTQFATAGRDRTVRLYDEATKEIVRAMVGGDMKETVGHSNRITALKYHPSERDILLTGGWDNTVQIWDARVGHSVQSLWDVTLYGDAVDFSADGSQILTGSWREKNAVQVWDYSKCSCIENIVWQTPEANGPCMVFSAQFSKDPTSMMIIAGGSHKNEAKLFTRTSGAAVPFGAVVNMPKPVFSVDFAPNSRLAAVAGGDGVVRVVEIQ